MTAFPVRSEDTARPGFVDRFLATRITVDGRLVLYVALFAAAFALRFWDLGSRALHHDESIHAQWSWGLLQGSYRHSPIFHGPFYYHVQGFVFLLFGASDYTARVSAAFFGSLIVALPLLLRRRLGPAGTMAAVGFLALSPTLVFFSRFFREDIYMACFTLLMVVTIWRYIEEGRDRWLIAFALAFTGSMTSKEGTFLTVAVFLVYLDLYLSAQLASATLSARGMDSPFRRFVLTGAFAPYAWAAAALWPFIGPIRRSLDWEELPRSGDVLIVMGTLILPLLTPLGRTRLLEPLGILDKDRLNWEKKLQGNVSSNDRLALAGLFTVTVSLAAFVGLQWRPRTWAIAFGVSTVVYLTLVTSLWTNLDGLVSGPWGSLDYWQGQQDEHRGDQPWFYYDILMPMYEFLPLVVCIAGAWWATVRGDAFSRFLVVWLAGLWLVFSWTSEKMPWNNTHLAVPACLLAAWTVQRAWSAWRPSGPLSRPIGTLLGVAAVALGAFAVIAFLPGGVAFTALRLGIALALAVVVVLAARSFGRVALPAFLLATVMGALSLFSVRTMVMASFVRGDVPLDMLVYTQTSPDVAELRSEIDALAAATGKGYDLPIAVDTTSSFAWPWAWYLRDYRSVAYVDLSNNVPDGVRNGDYAVIMVNQGNLSRLNDSLAGSPAAYAAARKYPHRWWFPEIYKDAMATKPGRPCLTKTGDCGPFNPNTWRTLADGVAHGGWLETWFLFWRDHDPDALTGAEGDRRCNSCGSEDGFALFPANFDPRTRTISVRPIEPSKPTFDRAGRPSFGGLGVAPGQFLGPVDVESDRDGNLYVVDSKSHRLQKFDRAGNFLAAVDVRLNPGDTKETSSPWGLALAANGDVIVADSFAFGAYGRVRVFDRDLKPTGVVFGQAVADPDKPGSYELYGPRDVAVDPAGNIWVADTGNARLMVYTARGEFVKSVGSRGNGPGQFDEPTSIAVDARGDIYVADMWNRRVQILDPSGAYRSEFAVAGWGGQDSRDKPYLRILRDGRIALSLPALNQVRIYDRSGGLLATISPTDEPLSSPYGIVETADGKLWISEGGSGRLRLFTVP